MQLVNGRISDASMKHVQAPPLREAWRYKNIQFSDALKYEAE